MKILFVLGMEVNPKVGGVERVTHVLSNHFINAGIKVGFLYFSFNELYFSDYNQQITTCFLPDITQVNTNENTEYLKELVVGDKIDIVINQGNIAADITMLIANSVQGTSCKIISILHNTPLNFLQFYGQFKQTFSQYLSLQDKNVKNILKKKLLILMALNDYQKTYKKYLRLAVHSSERFVLLSKEYIPLLNRISKIKDSRKIISIANPLSYADNYPTADIPFKKKQVIYVGRLEYNQKRLDRLLNIWKMVEEDFPDWKLIIVGGSLPNQINDDNNYQNKELQRLKLLSSQLKLNHVFFAGNQDPATYYKESSLFCLTSSYEGFPMALVEALQYGVVPVVFGSFEAIYDLIENDKNGSIITPFDLEEFSLKLKEQMLNTKRRVQMAIVGVATSKAYSVDVIGEQWIQTFRNVIDGT
ncbi:glycosyltransferase [Ferruginibacter sp.]|uniref:glycosyltransferase n=1 Tax=Ferruginibacter sp. TaxID=1940288 RepID=UPI002657C52A|nr:glycosyltransferase [Ferruginibacter sp.]